MSNNDISRFLFQPAKHYTGMRMQQGRVLLDSDYNEGASYGDEDQRRALLDLIGPQGTPDNTGFLIGTIFAAGPGGETAISLFNNASVIPLKPGDTLGFTPVEFNGTSVNVPNYFIGQGSMYVGGMRVELERTEFIALQADYLQASDKNMPNMAWDVASGSSGSSSGPGNFVHVFYLHVWEQWISAVEDDEFLEHALGGPDTSLRVRRMRRVEFSPGETGMTCGDALEGVLLVKFGALGTFNANTGELVSSGLLQITFTGNQAEDTCAPCDPSTTGRYLGAENQAIRIMLTTGVSYVWAFDDAAPLYSASLTNVGAGSGNVTVKLLTLPKDEEHWPQTGRVVQILPWSAVLPNGEKVADEIGVSDGTSVFCTVATPYQPEDGTFTLNTSNDDAAAKLDALIHKWDAAFETVHPDIDGKIAGSDVPSEPRLFYVRFWHQTDGTNPDDIEIATNRGTPLGSTGLVPNFLSPGLPGDYWIAAVRPETPNSIIPEKMTSPQGAPPQGPRHFYAPLAVVSGTTTGTAQSEPALTISSISDCRRHIVPVTDMGCCTVIVGDGVSSFGQYNSIQAAIDALPPEGGHICVRQGVYVEQIGIHQRQNIVITGCGDLTVIQTRPGTGDFLIEIDSATQVTLRSLTLQAAGQCAISANSGSGPSNGIQLEDLRIAAIPSTGDTTTEDLPLVSFDSVGDVRMDLLDISASRRPGIKIVQGYTRLSRVTVRGADASAVTELPSGPLIELLGCFSLEIEDAHLEAFGQFGIQAFESVVKLRGCSIDCRPFSTTALSMSALEIQSTQAIDIQDCTFTMFSATTDSGVLVSPHAAIVLQCGGVFENNVVTTSTSSTGVCWGGIHVRGGSNNLTIRGNSITGGAGHGITLGSVTWNLGVPPTDTLVEPVGTSQMNDDGTVSGNLTGGFTGPNGNVYYPFCDPALVDVDIIDNDIENMGTNGISVISLLGIEVGPVVDLNGTCRILNNRIRHNLTNLSQNAPLATTAELPIGGTRPSGAQFRSPEGVHHPPFPTTNIPLQIAATPFAGIVLGGDFSNASSDNAPLHLEIRGNIIEDNGVSATGLPISGIVVLAGSNITIANNQIARNGTLTAMADNLQPGLRAGIAVLIAGGPVGYLLDIAGFFDDSLVTMAPNSISLAAHSLRVFDNVVAQPEGRALYAVGTGMWTIENNHFSSQGFHGSKNSNADIYAIGDVVYVHNLGRPLESVDVATIDHLLLEPGIIDYTSDEPPPPTDGTRRYTIGYLKGNLTNYGFAARPFFVGLGGHTVFNSNQVIYDWKVQQVNLAEVLTYSPVTLVSSDHIGVHANSFGLRINLQALPSGTLLTTAASFNEFTGGGDPRPNPRVGRPVLMNVVAAGFSADISNNRVAEGLVDSEVSIITLGVGMVSMMENITSHCSQAYAFGQLSEFDTGRQQTVATNLSYLNPRTKDGPLDCGDEHTARNYQFGPFFTLLFDQRTT